MCTWRLIRCRTSDGRGFERRRKRSPNCFDGLAHQLLAFCTLKTKLRRLWRISTSSPFLGKFLPPTTLRLIQRTLLRAREFDFWLWKFWCKDADRQVFPWFECVDGQLLIYCLWILYIKSTPCIDTCPVWSNIWITNLLTCKSNTCSKFLPACTGTFWFLGQHCLSLIYFCVLFVGTWTKKPKKLLLWCLNLWSIIFR